MELTPIGVRGASEIERALSAVTQRSHTGLVVLLSSLSLLHRKLIITLAAHHHLPTVYPFRYHVIDGGLISYGPDTIDQDRILKGENPADLPVQAATKFELVINLRTAKALGLDVPTMLLARADAVIE
jgi:ABC-type uncharacterized transport system substrate-binding protein